MAPNPRNWQKRIEFVETLTKLMADYQMRKSKLIKYNPTEKELREAMRLYMLILELVDEKDPNAIKMMEVLNSVSSVPEIQIKFAGFMDEILKKYPTGEIPDQPLMDAAEKWDVIDYILEDRLRALGISMKYEIDNSSIYGTRKGTQK